MRVKVVFWLCSVWKKAIPLLVFGFVILWSPRSGERLWWSLHQRRSLIYIKVLNIQFFFFCYITRSFSCLVETHIGIEQGQPCLKLHWLRGSTLWTFLLLCTWIFLWSFLFNFPSWPIESCSYLLSEDINSLVCLNLCCLNFAVFCIVKLWQIFLINAFDICIIIKYSLFLFLFVIIGVCLNFNMWKEIREEKSVK